MHDICDIANNGGPVWNKFAENILMYHSAKYCLFDNCIPVNPFMSEHQVLRRLPLPESESEEDDPKAEEDDDEYDSRYCHRFTLFVPVVPDQPRIPDSP
jgi:hypothetical protein